MNSTSPLNSGFQVEAQRRVDAHLQYLGAGHAYHDIAAMLRPRTVLCCHCRDVCARTESQCSACGVRVCEACMRTLNCPHPLPEESTSSL